MDYPGTDAELVRSARDGDTEAMNRLVDESLTYVLRWCARLGGTKVDAEDAAHDAMMIVLRRLPDLRDPEAFPAWTYGILRRTIAATAARPG